MNKEKFDEIRRGYQESRCSSAVKALSKRGFDARHFLTATEAANAVLEVIKPGSRVGAGGSLTLNEMELFEQLTIRGDEVIRHQSSDTDLASNFKTRKEAIDCPYYLTSSNAITMKGELVNTDGVGNRVAGMIFGSPTVIVVAGVNKLVANLGDAFTRIRDVAAPANARRLGLDVPCVERGYCVDCRSPLNICRVTAIIWMKPMMTDLKVFLVAEPLGL